MDGYRELEKDLAYRLYPFLHDLPKNPSSPEFLAEAEIGAQEVLLRDSRIDRVESARASMSTSETLVIEATVLTVDGDRTDIEPTVPTGRSPLAVRA